MDLLKIEHAKLVTSSEQQIKIFNPKIKLKKGLITVTGVLDFEEPISKEKIDELEKHLGFHSSANSKSNHMKIKGCGHFGTTVIIYKVHCKEISYSNLQVTFITYESLLHRNMPVQNKINNITCIGIEGLKIAFDCVTSYNSKRKILGKEKSRILQSKWDYTEQMLNFKWERKTYESKITIIEEDKNIVKFRFENSQGLDLSVYKNIRQQLRAFLSYPNGNIVNFREEHFEKNGFSYSRVNSRKKVKNTIRSEYVPIHSIHFRNKNILSDYLSCFDNFLLINQHIDLIGFIYLFNQSKTHVLETSIFTMLIALEKIASEYIDSSLCSTQNNKIINHFLFEEKISKTKKQFKEDFKNITGFQKLYSKLGNLNQNSKTNKKMEALLEFAQIKRTKNVNHLLTSLRNKAVHQGDIHTIGENGYENYKALTQLCNNLICNLIQYKGIRLIEQGEQVNYIDQKTNYNIDYKNYF